jgi:hypothetical protein
VALYLIDQATVGCYSVAIKFGRTIKISSLKNENFKLVLAGATPTQISTPFETINTIKDYNQISRILTLYWRTTELSEDTDYCIIAENLIDASGNIVATEEIEFTWANCGATPNAIEVQDPGLVPVLIEDKSIKPDIDVSYSIIAKNPNFYIEETIPSDGDFYLANDYNDGRVIVVFNERPASNFLSNNFFTCQRKKIQKGPSRWETITAEVKMHSWKPEVYIDFPSLEDATPSYFTPGKNYFEKGYKYRIKISKDVGI